jgi:hypothetical protein
MLSRQLAFGSAVDALSTDGFSGAEEQLQPGRYGKRERDSPRDS